MSLELLAVVLTILITIGTSVPIGAYLYRVFSGARTWLDPVLLPVERLVLRMSGIDADVQQSWRAYAGSLLVSNTVMWVTAFAILRLQHLLPLNPDRIGAMESTLAFNTASSFVTNTNLQHYSGETGL